MSAQRRGPEGTGSPNQGELYLGEQNQSPWKPDKISNMEHDNPWVRSLQERLDKELGEESTTYSMEVPLTTGAPDATSWAVTPGTGETENTTVSESPFGVSEKDKESGIPVPEGTIFNPGKEVEPTRQAEQGYMPNKEKSY